MNQREVGARQESRAAEYLESLGYHILVRNFRCRFGEIDIIASDRRYVVFVEVKLRASDRFVRAGAYVTPAKQARIRTAASLWLAEHETPHRPDSWRPDKRRGWKETEENFKNSRLLPHAPPDPDGCALPLRCRGRDTRGDPRLCERVLLSGERLVGREFL